MFRWGDEGRGAGVVQLSSIRRLLGESGFVFPDWSGGKPLQAGRVVGGSAFGKFIAGGAGGIAGADVFRGDGYAAAVFAGG